MFASLTATYYPNSEILRRQLCAIPDGWIRLIVDDGTSDMAWRDIARMLRAFDRVEVIRLPRNIGLAAAQNAGLRQLKKREDVGCVLLLDQDTEPREHAVELLVSAYRELADAFPNVGAVGPALIDPATDVHHGFHVVRRGVWKRISPLSGPPVPCATLNGSGTLMALDTAISLGGMDETLFIDMVDAEWSFRMSANGFGLYGVPGSQFLHRMGVETSRIWLFGWRVWPRRSPIRNRYVFRNSIKLMRRNYVPAVWKVWAVIKLSLSFVVALMTDPDRWKQLASMAAGVVDGLRRIDGKVT
ncbi:glycosyltransferase [Luteimonas terrae]|nr:glycosyltransferase [Luteimonas terrae]